MFAEWQSHGRRIAPPDMVKDDDKFYSKDPLKPKTFIDADTGEKTTVEQRLTIDGLPPQPREHLTLREQFAKREERRLARRAPYVQQSSHDEVSQKK